MADADITDELQKGGPALGDFLKAVGLAVAESQSKLDENLAATAKKLSETQLDVIAVFEQEIDNNGQMQAGTVHMQKLPLINYLMPTAYNYSRVYLEANMKVAEFNGERGMNIKAKSSSFGLGLSGNFGPLGGSGGGGLNYGRSSASASASSSVNTDSAVGDLHMESTLEPRGDIELPKPFIIQKGPRLQIQILSKSDLTGTATGGTGGTTAAAPVIGRKVSIKALLTDNAGAPLSSKALQISVDDPKVNYSATSLTTNTTGDVSIDLENRWGTLPTGESSPPPKQTVVRIWFGLVTQTVAISI